MAVTHETATRNAMADAVVDLVDGGTGAGSLVLETSGDVEVATLAFSATAFGAASSGTATAASISDDSSAAGGTVAQASFDDGDSTKILECCVPASGGGGDIELS